MRSSFERARAAGSSLRLRLVAEDHSVGAAWPHFEEHVEVRSQSFEEAYERLMASPGGFASTSVPTDAELRANADHQMPPVADFLALFKLIWKLTRSKTPRYFLYVAEHAGQRQALLREGRLAADALYGPGVNYELMAGFADRKEASRAQRVLEEALRRAAREPGRLESLRQR